jgi:site-specific DNA-methyltransferase (adenine-specific)
METNVLYYGDNLEILRKYIPSDSIDLIYLDPPFNSKKDYNILFRENDTQWSPAQIKAFEDTWRWDTKAEATYQDIITKAPMKLAKLISAMREGIGANDVMAYLVMMATRLAELHRVLQPTGSLYLHCDPTMSHYIKLILDQIFGPTNFRNEIVWKRTTAHGDVRRNFGRVSDRILVYSKTNDFVFNRISLQYDPDYIDKFYRFVEPETGRRYMLDNLASPNPRPNLTYEYRGYKPPPYGWKVSLQKMEQLDKEGRLHFPATKEGRIRVKRYLDEMLGQPPTNLWLDVPPISAQAKERLGYETQKPLSLLERIIEASSNEGDIILDPFCGCGTALVAAHKLNRKWIGIDITHLAIAVMRRRLQDHFLGIQVNVIGEPVDLPSAKELAKQDRYQFQWWALSLIGARPLGEKKKGADKGIDGVIPFPDDGGMKLKRVVVQVKSGHISVKDVRELKTVAGNDPIGVLLTLEHSTQPMRSEAAEAGFYESPLWQRKFPKIQILTVEEIPAGKQPKIPPPAPPPKAAPIRERRQPRLV